MPMIASFHNTIFDIKCSKCKRTQDNIYFQQRGYVFRTCNECRSRDARRRVSAFLVSVDRPHLPIPPSAPLEVQPIHGSATEDASVPFGHARLVRGIQYRNNQSPDVAREVRRIPDDSDTDDDVAAHRLYYVDSDGVVSVPYSDDAAVNAVLLLSSSAAAASSSSSAGYFVDEPDPEPEPEGP